MDLTTIILLSLVVGAVVIAATGLMIYMSSLVKSAYQLRVELQSEMEDGLRRIEDDMDKKSKWIKRDLVEEIEKSRNALSADNERRFAELKEGITRRLAEYEEALKRDRGETTAVLENHFQAIQGLDLQLRALRREQHRAEGQALAAAAAQAETPPAEQPPAMPAALAPPEEVPVAVSAPKGEEHVKNLS